MDETDANIFRNKDDLMVGAYTYPLFSSTLAVLVIELLCVKFETSYDPHIYC
jgi:hypothetical protein